MTLPNRAFGIELEVIFPRDATQTSVASALRRVGVECVDAGYSHITTSHWKVVSGASVNGNGGEIVSPKLQGEAGLAQAVKVTRALQEMGCKVDVSCGFHLHVDAADYDAKQLKAAATCYLWFETFFDHIMPASRRADLNSFVYSNRSRFGGYGTEALNAGIAALSAAPDNIEAVIEVMTECENYCRAIGGRCRCAGRYRKMNLTSLRHQRSIEFRQHSGTIEAEKVENWIRLMVPFVEAAKNSRPRPRTVQKEWSAAEEMHLFFAMFKTARPVALYYMERRKAIKKADADRTAQAQAEAAAAPPAPAAAPAPSPFRRRRRTA